MATQYATVEVWVVVDDAGDYATGVTAGAATERFEEDVRPVNETEGIRLVKLTVKVPLPTVIELAGEVTVDESETTLRGADGRADDV